MTPLTTKSVLLLPLPHQRPTGAREISVTTLFDITVVQVVQVMLTIIERPTSGFGTDEGCETDLEVSSEG